MEREEAGEAAGAIYLRTLKLTGRGVWGAGDHHAAQPAQGNVLSQFRGQAEAICFYFSNTLCSQNSWIELRRQVNKQEQHHSPLFKVSLCSKISFSQWRESVWFFLHMLNQVAK